MKRAILLTAGRTGQVLSVALALSAGCVSTRQNTDHAAPVSNRFVSRSHKPPVNLADAWNEWADAHLQDGDILFVRAEGYILMGTVNFSELSTDLTSSRFSHTGMVAIENKRAVVYDIRNSGMHRAALGELFADKHIHQAAIQRVSHAPHEARRAAVTYCREAYRDRKKFDNDFRLDNQRLYCSELIELAYRSGGISLSEPIRLRDLPHFDRHAKQIQLASAITAVEPDQLVYVPGNEEIGIWSNPDLSLILDVPDTKAMPYTLELEGSLHYATR